MSDASESPATYTAFLGVQRVAQGTKQAIAAPLLALENETPVLIFDDQTGQQVDLDLRAEEEKPRGPGRPKIGVVAREVTLLQKHWDWLNAQPGGASVALRKLVAEARQNPEHEQKRAKEAAYRFLSAMAGNLPNFEEASRALYAGDRPKFEEQVSDWPEDIRTHAIYMSGPAFTQNPGIGASSGV